MKGILFLITIFCALKVNAQNYLISFAGTGESNIVSTVNVKNLTAGTTLTLNGNDILHLTTIVTGVKSIDNGQLSELKIYPNPMTDNSTLAIYPPVAGDATISVFDITGKLLTQIQSKLDKGLQEFHLSGLKSGLYLISVMGITYKFSGKLLCNSKEPEAISIEKINYNQTAKKGKIKTDSKGELGTVDMNYTSGDMLKFTGISGNYSTVMMDIPTSDKTLTFNFIECTDGDGNNYQVVEIGTQLWMAENLRTTRYRRGSIIGINTFGPNGGDYIWPVGGSENNVPKYGRLYTHYAASDSACPIGWRLPEYIDWRRLTNGSDSIYTEDIASSDCYIEFPVGKSLAANTDWQTNEINGSVGNKQETNNSSGFNGLPAGSPGGNIGAYGTWWIREKIAYAEIEGDSKNLFIHIRYPVSPLQATSILNQGKSVRCTKGILSPVLSTSAVTSVTQITATSGGYITSDGGAYVTSCGVCWSTSPNPTIENARTIDGSGIGAFTSSIIGLTGNTTYYVRAYATNSTVTNYGNEVIFKTYTGTVSDIDENNYYTVTIGTQEWMAENLKTTKYSNGDLIGTTTPATLDISSESTPKYQWAYDGNESNVDIYGRLYTWYAATDSRKVCPTGWHVPTLGEWEILLKPGNIIDIKGAELMETGTNHWNRSDIVGTNETGFTALPGGYRYSSFEGMTSIGEYWSSDESAYPGSSLYYPIPISGAYDMTPLTMLRGRYSGLSVRCLKN
jgi:uncharacterized protein (TIGR02145 family)